MFSRLPYQVCDALCRSALCECVATTKRVPYNRVLTSLFNPQLFALCLSNKNNLVHLCYQACSKSEVSWVSTIPYVPMLCKLDIVVPVYRGPTAMGPSLRLRYTTKCSTPIASVAPITLGLGIMGCS